MSAFAAETLLFEPATPVADAIPVIFSFPNTYTIGISSLGYQIIWAMLAQRADVAVARLFTDTHEPLPRHPELVGFSMSWELDYINILALLSQLQIPARAAIAKPTIPSSSAAAPS